VKWTNEVWDKERRLTETKSTARRSGRGGGAAGVGAGLTEPSVTGPVPVRSGMKPVKIQNLNLNSKK